MSGVNEEFSHKTIYFAHFVSAASVLLLSERFFPLEDIICVQKNCGKWVQLLNWSRMNVSSVKNHLFYASLLLDDRFVRAESGKKWRFQSGKTFIFPSLRWCPPENDNFKHAKRARERSAVNNRTKLNYGRKKKKWLKNPNCGISASVSV